MTCLFEFLSEGTEVLDFAIEHTDIAPASRLHGLMSEWGWIQYGQSAVPQRDTSLPVHPGAAIVRSPVP